MTFLRAIKSIGRFRPRPEPDCACPEGLPGDDPAFSQAITALGAKLARADGRADEGEFQTFVEVFPAEESAARDIRRLYGLARETTRGYEGYARMLAKRYDRCPHTLAKVLDGLFHVAASDKAITVHELAFLERVGEIFGLSQLTFRRLKAEHLGLAPGDPYGVLGVAPDAPDETVRAAWKQALSASHPDRAVGRGLPQELVEAAQTKAAAINAAFDAVMRERRSLALGAV